VEADLGLEDEPAAVPEDQVLGGLEILRAVLLPDHEAPVADREVHLHRADRRARSEPRLLLRHQEREAGQFREPCHRALPIREVASVQVQPALQEVLARLVHDLPIREIRLPPPLDEPIRVPTEPQVHAMLCGLPREVRHRERVPAIREDDVWVDVPHGRVQRLEDLRFAALDLDLANAGAEELVLEPRDPERVVDVDVEDLRAELRDRIVERELLLLRPPSAVVVPQEAAREDPVREAVPLAEPEVDVVQRVVVVPAVRRDDLRDVLEFLVVAGDDFEDGHGLLAPDVDAPLDLPDLLHLVEDPEALSDLAPLGRRGPDEERDLELRVLDPVGPALSPQPQDDRVLVVVRIRVDEPTLRG